MKKKKILVIVISVLVLIAFLIGGKKAGWFGKADDLKQVEVALLEKMNLIETVSATGKIQPEVEVKLSSEVSGEIIELPIKEGQRVEKGDLLVKINPDLYQSSLQRSQASYQNIKANLEQAKASLKEAEANYNRNKTLFEKGVISQSEWDAVLSRYEVAKATQKSAYYNVQSAAATVNEAQDNLGRTTIYAPMSGTISKLDAELGERVVGTQQMAGTEILRVANLNEMEVEVDVNENDIVKINVGDSALVEVDAYLDKKFKGLVTAISNSANDALSADQVTNFKVKVKILKESYADLLAGKGENYSPFRPGMTATVDIITNSKKDILAVPISAIVIKAETTKSNASGLDDKTYEAVFIKEEGKAKLQAIKTGIQDETNIEILEGLKEGDEIITGPYSLVTKKLKDGHAVEEIKKSK
ncbi:efflux RND transporter periplasmic adaptor subunit [uncultured Mesonia sp.]|uniref:efflux RND transporter periplasmic adaptor subunit n=1 Tax=uncultured Mesonia sp. TaxID=399731 RepID=UPI00374F4F49